MDLIHYAKAMLNEGQPPIFVELRLISAGCTPEVAELLVAEVTAEEK